MVLRFLRSGGIRSRVAGGGLADRADGPSRPKVCGTLAFERLKGEVIAEHGAGAFAGDFGETGGGEGFQDGFGPDAFGHGGPIELEEAAGIGVAGEKSDDAREETVHVPFAQREGAP